MASLFKAGPPKNNSVVLVVLLRQFDFGNIYQLHAITTHWNKASLNWHSLFATRACGKKLFPVIYIFSLHSVTFSYIQFVFRKQSVTRILSDEIILIILVCFCNNLSGIVYQRNTRASLLFALLFVFLRALSYFARLTIPRLTDTLSLQV